MLDKIIIKGAREHNLKNIDVEIPKNKFIVITGVSGSGKSSLAFDTIYSEGQRRYVESLSAYARQFIGQMTKPDVDSIEGLAPAISIEQKTTNRNPRSTVGTITEVYDYMRLLFAHIGTAHCPVCGRKVEKQSTEEIVTNRNPRSTVGTITEVYDYMRLLFAHIGTAHCPVCGRKVEKQSTEEIVNGAIERFDEGAKMIVLAPLVKEKKGTHKNLFLNLQKKGFVRVRVNGEILYLEDEIELDKNKKHDIAVVVDRLVLKKEDKDFESRLTQSVESATELASGKVLLNVNGEDFLYSENFACPEHEEVNIPDLNPRLFSFNAPFGACPECKGIGKKLEIDENKLIENEELSIADGGLYIPGASSRKGYTWEIFKTMAKHFKIDINKPVKDLSKEELDIILHGTDVKFRFDFEGSDFQYHGYKEYEGAVRNLERRYNESFSEAQREEIENKFMIERVCKVCNGKRLKPEVLGVTIQDKNIMEICDLSIKDALEFFMNLKLTPKQETIAKEILKEIRERLSFMINVGLDYLNLARETKTLSGGEAQRIRLATQIGSGLTGVLIRERLSFMINVGLDYLNLARETKTLSGGEAQRIRLATQIGSGLTGVLYVLDEPSIGLHQKDNDKLLATLERLKNLGNTLIVVEHDEDTMLQADKIFDLGPGAGEFGGNIVASGSPKEIMRNKNSLTGRYLKGELKIEVPKIRRKWEKNIKLLGAKGNNLKNIDVEIPLGVFTVVTGVSGSGKSSLINHTLFPVLF